MTADTRRHASPATAPPASARALLRLLQGLQVGLLELHTPQGQVLRFGPGGAPAACLHLHDWSVCARVLKSGDIGLAEAYMDREWDSPDLSAFIRLCIANRDAIERAVYGSPWGALLYRLRHLLRRNSRRGSQRNIPAHYDLGNAFYRLWLDPTMNYSSAWFDGQPARPLAEAQDAKVGRALQEAGVQAGDRVLEIGCGWGAVAERAARDFGAHVTGVTLSHEQLAWARERLASQGLAHRGDLRLQDYRDITRSPGFQPYDAVVSIEMFEAVGPAYWPSYFETLRRCLKPRGRACVQTITLREDLYARYLKSTDFIQQYVFPGGQLPSSTAFRAAAAKAGLAVTREFAFGPDYAETLRRWRQAFAAQRTAVEALGFDARFMRLWPFYLSYCEAAFDSGNANVVQFTLEAT